MSEAKRWLLGGYQHGFWANLPHPVATDEVARWWADLAGQDSLADTTTVVERGQWGI